MADSSLSASASLAAGGRPSGRSSRIFFGTACAISVSTEVTPSAVSMARRSCGPGPTWRLAHGLLISVSLADHGLVGGFVHQPFQLALVRNLHLPQPPGAGGIRIDQRWVGRQAVVHRGDLAID